MKKKYKVTLNCILVFEVDALNKKHSIEYSTFLASRDTEKIKIKGYTAKIVGPVSEDLEDLS